MAKVTSKLQLTVPKAIANQYGIHPGDELEWVAAGETIRIIPARNGWKSEQPLSLKDRLALFDEASQRQKRRQKKLRTTVGRAKANNRGWTREDLYQRGFTR